MPMSVQVECPRCDKRQPGWAAYCRRCGLPLDQARPARLVSPPSTPPVTRLVGILIVGACLISMALLNSRTSPSRSGRYPGGGGGGGGGGVVHSPFNLWQAGPNGQTTPGNRRGHRRFRSDLPYTPGYDYGRNRHLAPYGIPMDIENPRSNGVPGADPYGGPSARAPGGGASRGPSR